MSTSWHSPAPATLPLLETPGGSQLAVAALPPPKVPEAASTATDGRNPSTTVPVALASTSEQQQLDALYALLARHVQASCRSYSFVHVHAQPSRAFIATALALLPLDLLRRHPPPNVSKSRKTKTKSNNKTALISHVCARAVQRREQQQEYLLVQAKALRKRVVELQH